MTHWDKIYHNLSSPSTSLLYIGVGSSMNHYAEVTNENNQQYPCFLSKINKSHLVILIDPLMETNLKLVDYFRQQGDPLTLISQTNWNNCENMECSELLSTNAENTNTCSDSTSPHVREYKNSKGTFFVINDYFYSEIYNNMPKNHFKKASESISIMYQLVTIALGKIKPCKIIYQDYTGVDTTNFYCNLFTLFDRATILSHVCFDVTQDDGGCFIEFNSNMIQFNSEGNFIQEKYARLETFPTSNNYSSHLKKRIDILSYPTTWNYINLKMSPSFKQIFAERVIKLASFYDLEFDPLESQEKLCNQYLHIIQTVINDIVKSRDIDASVEEYLLENLENRSEFINALSILKFE